MWIYELFFRSEEKAKPFRENYLNIEIVTGCDAERIETLNKAFKGVDYALIVTPHDKKRGFDDDANLTVNMIEAAVANKVKYIVMVSSFTVNHPERMPILSSRCIPSERLLEKYGKEKGLKWTILRGGCFMENAIQSVKQALLTSVFYYPDINVAYVDTKDIGRSAAACLARDIDEHNGKCYELSGPEKISGERLTETIAKVFNKKIVYEKAAKEFLQKIMPKAAFQAYDLMIEDQDCVPFNDDVKKLTGQWSNYEEFLKDHYDELIA